MQNFPLIFFMGQHFWQLFFIVFMATFTIFSTQIIIPVCEPLNPKSEPVIHHYWVLNVNNNFLYAPHVECEVTYVFPYSLVCVLCVLQHCYLGVVYVMHLFPWIRNLRSTGVNKCWGFRFCCFFKKL
jgi:hypothetical protein